MRPYLLKLFLICLLGSLACGGALDSGKTHAGATPLQGPTTTGATSGTSRPAPAFEVASVRSSRKANTKAKTAVIPEAKSKALPAAEQVHPELLSRCTEARRIVVYKSKRLLELRCGEKLAGRYPVGLGFEPKGHKQKEGDGRTPEGVYGIAFKHHGQFHRALRLSYPNRADADAGLADGRISRAEYQAIRAAHRRCIQPPQTTQLGSLLEIHGGGASSDWTLGCVALKNPAIEKVYRFHQGGCLADGTPRTPVHILR